MQAACPGYAGELQAGNIMMQQNPAQVVKHSSHNGMPGCFIAENPEFFADQVFRHRGGKAEISLLLAGPGLMATLTFAPYVIRIFYRGDFGPAVEILRWICLGMMFRVAGWPMGFILVAKGAQKPFFWCELLSNSAIVLCSWIGVAWFGLDGTGIGFCAALAFYFVLISLLVRPISAFRWSASNRRIGLLYGLRVLALFAGWYLLDRAVLLVLGSAITVFAGLYTTRRICSLVALQRVWSSC